MKWIGVARASRFSLAMTLALLGASQPAAADERPTSAPSARLKIEQLQIAFVASGTLGGGTLYYQGRSYPVKIGGLGIGGVGASRLAASGKVYGLTRLDDFPGAYAEIRSGWALGERGKGRIWLRNAKGVTVSLEGSREGLQLALGADGVVIGIR